MLMSPTYPLRGRCTASASVYFEWMIKGRAADSARTATAAPSAKVTSLMAP